MSTLGSSLERLYRSGSDALRRGAPTHRSGEEVRHADLPRSGNPVEPAISAHPWDHAIPAAELDPLPYVDDRRGFPRHGSHCQVTVWPSSAGLPADRFRKTPAGSLRGRLLDVSMSGVAMWLPTQMTVGTGICLRISDERTGDPILTEGKTLRSEALDAGGFRTVCQLDRHLTFEQIHRIGQNLFASTIV